MNPAADNQGAAPQGCGTLKGADPDATLTPGAGVPLPPFLNAMDDARWWAGLASRGERKAYCLAAFEAMPPADQAAFLHHVQHGRNGGAA